VWRARGAQRLGPGMLSWSSRVDPPDLTEITISACLFWPAAMLLNSPASDAYLIAAQILKQCKDRIPATGLKRALAAMADWPTEHH